MTRRAIPHSTPAIIIGWLMACGHTDAPPGPALPVASIEIHPRIAELQMGDTLTLRTVLRDARGRVLPSRPVAWSSNNPALAEVTETGRVSGRGHGEVRIAARVEGLNDTAVVRVVMGRTAAIELVRLQLLDTLSAPGVMALITPAALPPGTKVSHAAGVETLQAPVFVLADSGYFVFVDLFPTALFEHPVIYALLDLRSGLVTTATASLPPRIDGALRWLTWDERVASPDRFEPTSSGVWLTPTAGDHTVATRLAPILRWPRRDQIASTEDTPCRKVAVTIAGGADSWIKQGARNMADALLAQGFLVFEYDSKVNTLGEVESAISAVGEGLGPCDKFLIYIFAHGSPDAVHYGLGEPNYALWSKQNHDFSLLDLIDDQTAAHVNVVIEGCYAASIFDAASNPPVIGTNGFAPKAGVTINIFASSAADRYSFGSVGFHTDEFGLPQPDGGVYSNSLIAHLKHNPPTDTNGNGAIDVDEFEDAFEAAHAGVVGRGYIQMPEVATFIGPPPPPPLYSFSIANPFQDILTVVSTPQGIQCGTDCSESFEAGTTVQLSVDIKSGNTWEWIGCGIYALLEGGITVHNIDGTKLCTLQIAPPTVSVAKTGTGSGTIATSDVAIHCGTTCSASFPFASSLDLVALPAAGSVFVSWEGDCAGRVSPRAS